MNSLGTIVAVNFGSASAVSVGVVDRVEDGAEYIRLLKDDLTWMEPRTFAGGNVIISPMTDWKHTSDEGLRFRKDDIAFIVREGDGRTTLLDPDGNEVARLFTLQINTAESDVGEAQKDGLGQAIFNVRTYAGVEGLTMAADAYKLLTVVDVIAMIKARL